MTGMMDFFKKLMDEENEPLENQDNVPEFMKSLELRGCPFCNGDKFLCTAVETLRGIDVVFVCCSCNRAVGLSIDRASKDIVIVGEIDPQFLPDFLE